MLCLHHHRLRRHRGRCHHNDLANFFVAVITVVVIAVASNDGGIGDVDFGGSPPPSSSPSSMGGGGGFTLLSVAHALSSTTTSTLLPESAIRTIEGGGIAIISDFLPPSAVSRLRRDAYKLYLDGNFIVDSLAGYVSKDGHRDKSKFDPAKDRAVLPSYVPSKNRSGPFVDRNLGDVDARMLLANTVGGLRRDLARALDRPGLIALSYDEFAGVDGHELSYTRFGPGASLARHVDEHHEEVKGKSGWSRPTRRSLSWLVYLNENDWDVKVDGGELCTHGRLRKTPKDGGGVVDVTVGGGPVGSHDGDLQIGWLAPSSTDDMERPVFLDGRRGGVPGRCALYVVGGGDDEMMSSTMKTTTTSTRKGKRLYLTKEFESDPYLFLTSDFFVRNLLIRDHELGKRFRYIEPPRGKLSSNLFGVGNGEERVDVAPMGGTLVVFDSVALPHEVLPSLTRERWAASGWFHERQQPAPDGSSRIIFS
jgi:hypothetical protein